MPYGVYPSSIKAGGLEYVGEFIMMNTDNHGMNEIEAINIYINPLSVIPGDVVSINSLQEESMRRNSKMFIVLDLSEVGDWGLCIGEDSYFRFGYQWGDIRVFDGAEYVAQHSDTQFHAERGWSIRIKFCPIAEYLYEGSDFMRSSDGKELISKQPQEDE